MYGVLVKKIKVFKRCFLKENGVRNLLFLTFFGKKSEKNRKKYIPKENLVLYHKNTLITEVNKELSKEKTNGNVVFIGSKSVMQYVLSCITQLNEGNNDLVLKARGRAISRAVDTAEIIRNRFVPDAVIKDIKISTEQIERSEGGTANVSAIEITIAKKK